MCKRLIEFTHVSICVIPSSLYLSELSVKYEVSKTHGTHVTTTRQLHIVIVFRIRE